MVSSLRRRWSDDRRTPPPRSTGNDQPVSRALDPFDLNRTLEAVAAWSNGHVVLSLDATCNSRASNWGYVSEYKKMHDTVLGVARGTVRPSGLDPLRQDGELLVDLPYDFMPARFVRQIVGMFLAVQALEHLFATGVRSSS